MEATLCPKCQKPLTPCQDKSFAYCPRKDIIVKFGPPYDRRYKIQQDPTAGCGTLFEMPVSEHDYWAEMDRRYRPVVNRANATGHSAMANKSASNTNVNG